MVGAAGGGRDGFIRCDVTHISMPDDPPAWRYPPQHLKMMKHGRVKQRLRRGGHPKSHGIIPPALEHFSPPVVVEPVRKFPVGIGNFDRQLDWPVGRIATQLPAMVESSQDVGWLGRRTTPALGFIAKLTSRILRHIKQTPCPEDTTSPSTNYRNGYVRYLIPALEYLVEIGNGWFAERPGSSEIKCNPLQRNTLH